MAKIDTSGPKTCRFTFYAQPAVLNPGPAGRDGLGHVFIGLADANGIERVYGYHAGVSGCTPPNVPPEDAIWGFKNAFKRVASSIQDDSQRQWQQRMDYPITQSQYDAMLAKVEVWRKDPPKYVLAYNNCVTFAAVVAGAGKVRPPAQIFILPVPNGAAWAIRLKRPNSASATRCGGWWKRPLRSLARNRPKRPPPSKPKMIRPPQL